MAAKAAADKEEEARNNLLQAAGVPAAGTLINTLADPPSEFRLVDGIKLTVVSTASGPKKIKKHTSLIQWSEGVSLTTKTQNKYFSLELAPSSLIYCKEELACMTLAKAYKDHWLGYDHMMGYQKFAEKGKLPKALMPDDPDKKRYFFVAEPAKVGMPTDTVQKIIEAARDSSQLQAAVSI